VLSLLSFGHGRRVVQLARRPSATRLLWLPYTLAARHPGFALAVTAFGLVCLRNYRSHLPQARVGLLTARERYPRR